MPSPSSVRDLVAISRDLAAIAPRSRHHLTVISVRSRRDLAGTPKTMEKMLEIKSAKPEDAKWRARASAAVAVAGKFRPSSGLENEPKVVTKSKKKQGGIAGAWDKVRARDARVHGMLE